MVKKEIDSIETLLEVIASLSTTKGEQLYFRGQQKNFDLVTPSIGRNKSYLENEDKLFKEYILRNPNEFIDERTTFEKLVKMQHYKLPTRLLDITTNPLVALYFAVEEDEKNENEDGDFIVYVLPPKSIKYYDSDSVSVVANVARRPIDNLNIKIEARKEGEREEDWIARFNKNNDVQYLLHEIKDEKPYFKDIIKKEHLESIWCVKPLLKNRRIVKQDGAFLLFGIESTKKNLASYRDFEPIHFVVNKKNKKELRKILKLLGISKDKLFPELDTTAEYLRTFYCASGG